MDKKIDFVITWGSNDDPEWRIQYEYYSAKAGRTVDRECRKKLRNFTTN